MVGTYIISSITLAGFCLSLFHNVSQSLKGVRTADKQRPFTYDLLHYLYGSAIPQHKVCTLISE